MPKQNPDYVHEKVAGIDIVTLCAYDDAWVPDRYARITKSLFSLIDGGAERLIIDFTNIELIGSGYAGMLIRIARRLCGTSWHPLTMCPDRETALDVIANSDSSPLVLCSVSPEVRKVIRTLRLCDD